MHHGMTPMAPQELLPAEIDPGTPDPTPARPRGAPRRKDFGTRSVGFLRARWRPLLLIGFIVLVLVVFKAVLTPFIVAFALAYVLHPAVQRLTRIQVRGAHLPVWTSILIVYVVLISAGTMFFSLAGPPVLAQLQKLIENTPNYAAQADAASNKFISRLETVLASWEERGKEPAAVATNGEEVQVVISTNAVATETVVAPRSSTVGQAAKDVLSGYRYKAVEWLKQLSGEMPAFIEGLVRSIFTFFMVLMLTFMFLIYFPTLFTFMRRLVPVDYRAEFENIAREVNQRLAGVVRGQLLICLMNGILTYIGFSLIGVKFASLLAFVAGVLSLIPIFGTIISTIPAALIGFADSLAIGAYVVGWVIFIHILEAYVLNPKIMGDSAHMNPLFIVFAILVGSHYFHPVLGPLLAAPIAAIIQTVFLHFLTFSDRNEAGAEQPLLELP
jgi:predicted PurR-regulated permease PerM